MMKRIVSITAGLFFLIFSPVNVQAVAVFYDGQSHTINDATYAADILYVDQTVINNPGTHIDLIAGGNVRKLFIYHNSSALINGGTVRYDCIMRNNSSLTMEDGSIDKITVSDSSRLTISGGQVETFFWIYDNSTVNISGGTMAWIDTYHSSTLNISGGEILSLDAWTDSQITITGGSVNQMILAMNNSTVTISGGTIGGQLYASDNSTIYLIGTNFQANGQSLSYGDKLSDYGIYNATLTGILNDGTAISVPVSTGTLDTAEIIIIPEPATLLLLTLGTRALRKRK